MIERIDELLYRWGDWVSASRVGVKARLTSSYGERGVMGTNEEYDDEMAEWVDKVLAQMPGADLLRVIKRKYWFHVPDDIACKDLSMSRSKYKSLVDKAHYWIDGCLSMVELRD